MTDRLHGAARTAAWFSLLATSIAVLVRTGHGDDEWRCGGQISMDGGDDILCVCRNATLARRIGTEVRDT